MIPLFTEIFCHLKKWKVDEFSLCKENYTEGHTHKRAQQKIFENETLTQG